MIGQCLSFVIPHVFSILQCQQFALKAYSTYTPGPFDLKLGRKHRDDLKGDL